MLLHFKYVLNKINLSGIALGCELANQGFESWQGLQIFLLTTVSRAALESTQPPINGYQGLYPGREADHSPPSSAEIKNAWSYTSTPPIRLHGVVLS
jgi:hypothetical protein